MPKIAAVQMTSEASIKANLANIEVFFKRAQREQVELLVSDREAARFFEGNEKIALVGGPAVPFENDEIRYRAGGYILSSPFLVGFVSSRYQRFPHGFETKGEHLILANTLVVRSAFDAVGGFDVGQIPCEDGYFYFRLREKGFHMLHAPEVFVWHRAKPVFKGLCKRVFLYGLGRGGVTARNWKTMHPAYLVPSLFTLSLVVLPFLAIFSQAFLGLLVFELWCYFLFDLAISFSIFFNQERRVAVWFLVFLAVPLVHMSYGLGVLYGIYVHIAKRGKTEMSFLRKFEA